MRRAALRLTILVSLALPACTSSGDEAAPTPPGGDLYGELRADEVSIQSAIEVQVDHDLLTAEDPDPRYKVGLNIPVGAQVELSSVTTLSGSPAQVAHGAIRTLGDGFVWSARVEAPGATAMRLELSDMYLPRNAKLYLYNDHGDVAGPYVGRGPHRDGHVWSHTLRGERIHLQLRYSGVDTRRSLGAARFEISGAGYLDDRFLLAVYSPDDNYRAFCNFNEDCVFNAECSNVPSAIEAARGGVAYMEFVSGPYIYLCSGGLLADRDPGTDIPYFLTANHCISKDREAKSLETFFNFTTPCDGSCYRPDTPSALGATIVAGNKTSDYTLMRLDSTPSGATFLPYNEDPVAFNGGAALHRISHPGGAPQAYSEHSVDTDKGTCTSWPRGPWIYSEDTYGATEGGSSGSPVLNASGQVVGQLSGACGTNVNDNCDTVNNATVDGALAHYYAEVEGILDPSSGGGGGCTDADGDGYCAEEDCDDNDSSVNPGASESCDSVDNDCDGQIDEGCDDGGGTCDLEPKGAACVNDSECCSSKCKGKPGSKSCK